MVIGMLAMFGALFGATEAPTKAEIKEARANAAAALAGRPEARISTTWTLDTFRVERENHDDILYLSTGFGKWYRAPMTCFGMGDAENAMRIVPIDRGLGIDRFTKFKLLGLGRSHFDNNECMITSLIELTPQETVIFGLETQKRVDERAAREAARQAARAANR